MDHFWNGYPGARQYIQERVKAYRAKTIDEEIARSKKDFKKYVDTIKQRCMELYMECDLKEAAYHELLFKVDTRIDVSIQTEGPVDESWLADQERQVKEAIELIREGNAAVDRIKDKTWDYEVSKLIRDAKKKQTSTEDRVKDEKEKHKAILNAVKDHVIKLRMRLLSIGSISKKYEESTTSGTTAVDRTLNIAVRLMRVDGNTEQFYQNSRMTLLLYDLAKQLVVFLIRSKAAESAVFQDIDNFTEGKSVSVSVSALGQAICKTVRKFWPVYKDIKRVRKISHNVQSIMDNLGIQSPEIV